MVPDLPEQPRLEDTLEARSEVLKHIFLFWKPRQRYPRKRTQEDDPRAEGLCEKKVFKEEAPDATVEETPTEKQGDDSQQGRFNVVFVVQAVRHTVKSNKTRRSGPMFSPEGYLLGRKLFSCPRQRSRP